MRNRLLAVVIAAALAVVLWPPGSAQANHSSGYHWARTANPFTVEFEDNVTSAWDSYLNTAANDWTQSTILDTVVLRGSFGSKSCRPNPGHVEVCNSTYGNTGWLSIAQIWVTGGNHITQASVKLNDTYLSSPPYNTPAWHQLLMCQEIGRTLGLSLQDTNASNPNLGSCMDFTSNPSGPPSNEHPNQHDYDELVSIYTHFDAVNTTMSVLRAGKAAGTDVITYVTWA
ncbi:MAG: hypothetical protein ACM30G_15170 [Micromonosporaceae bacterium]